MSVDDTIFARASGAGKAGIAVFRLSGAQSSVIARQLVGKRIVARTPVLTKLTDPASGDIIDRGLVILFEQPASFTSEDVVEFHLHGSRAVEASLYETLSRLGARPAEAGEFTLRALKNGKLDLAQAEALADLIDAETTLQRKQALGQMDGRLSAVAEAWRGRVLSILAPLEADIDFPDEDDVPAAVAARAGPAIDQLKDELTSFLANSGRARTIRDGVSIAIIGAPNAGKSSLLNALAGSEVAIVSDQPGTTRDVVEARLDLGGILATLADTAGLREAAGDAIEAEGMARARSRAAAADIRVMVADPGGPLPVDALQSLSRGDYLIWSKSDLSAKPPELAAPAGVNILRLSAQTGAGLVEFVESITEFVSRETQGDGPALTRARHVGAVEDALSALSRARENVEAAPELAAEDARLAARALGAITGAVGVEDVLGEIFSSFCIGK